MSTRILSKLNQRDFKAKPLIGKYKIDAVHRYVSHKKWVRANKIQQVFHLSALEIKSLGHDTRFGSVGPVNSDYGIAAPKKASYYLRSNSFMAGTNSVTMMRRYYAKERARRLAKQERELTPLEILYNEE